jgi:NDP-sugar pyrophosphorylase family protein
MQAVILAAGRGTRMGALTESTPKPMLQVAGKTLLEYKFDALPAEIDEIILIVGYLGGEIQKRFGGEYKGKRVLYIEQENPVGGTANALWAAQDILHNRFVSMYGDDIYDAEDMKRCLALPDWVILAQERDSLESAAKIVTDEKGIISDILEAGTHTGGSGLANTGLYVLDTRIFNYEQVKLPGREETGLPQTMLQAKHDIPIHVVTTSKFIAVTNPDDLKKAEDLLQQH